MRTKTGTKRAFLVPAVALALIVSACGNEDSTASDEESSSGETGGSGGDGGGGPIACLGEEGCVPDGQPDVNGDGTVDIGVLSPGDTNDNGYYESFVVTAREFADENGWELIILDQVNPSDAAEQARNLCRQGVDMVAIAAGELADALPVAEEDVCASSVWYVAGGAGVEQTPYFFQSSEEPGPTQFVTGYATGLVMEKLGLDKGGFVTGPELDFSRLAFGAWTAGIHQTLPDAETVATYTGDFDDSALGQEAANAQLGQGVGILYPYLGGATDAVATAGAERDVLSVTPGTDRCAEDQFAVSSIFSPGDYFAATLEDFEAGEVEIGVTRMFLIGEDPVPTVEVCPSVEGYEDLQAQVDTMIADVASGEVDVDALIEADGN